MKNYYKVGKLYECVEKREDITLIGAGILPLHVLILNKIPCNSDVCENKIRCGFKIKIMPGCRHEERDIICGWYMEDFIIKPAYKEVEKQNENESRENIQSSKGF